MAGAAALLVPLLLLGLPPAGHPEEPTEKVLVFPSGSQPVQAVEDTFPGPVYQMKGIEVVAPRIPLKELIRKAREGERHKYDGLTTLAFTRTIRVTSRWEGKKARTRMTEIVQRVYFRAPDDWVEATLLDSTWVVMADGSPGKAEDDDEDKVSVTVDRRQLAEIPYYLERIDKFRFDIARRSATDSTILYEVDFRPLSDFDELPGGKLWLLTPGYQIVREEFSMENLPFPWVLKELDHLVREWQPVGDRWLEKRITGRARLGLNFLTVPHAIEFVARFDDYRINPELDPKIFDGKGR
jgi:hypothetical protein